MIRACVTDDRFGFGVQVGIIDEHENTPPVLIRFGAREHVTLARPEAATEPSLRLEDAEARALLDALTRYYHGAEDTRALRADYDAERKRVDQLIATVSGIASRDAVEAG